MKAGRAWLMRLFGVFGSTRAERELSAEIESHLQLHIDDNIRAGLSPEEARRRAVIALGGVERTKEEYRDRRGLPAVESLARDLRYGVRTLIKSPPPPRSDTPTLSHSPPSTMYPTPAAPIR